LRAIRVQPDDFFAHYNLARAYEYTGQLQESALAFQKALQIRSDDADALVALGVLYHRLCQKEEAQLTLKKAISSQPDHIGAHFQLARIYLESNRYDEAIVRLKKVLGIDPEVHLAQFYLARVYESIGFLSEALDSIEKALEIVPQNFYYHLKRAQVALAMGNFDLAVQVYRKAVSSNPESTDALGGLMNLCFEMDYHQEAKDAALELLALEPNSKQAHLILGRSLLRTSQFEQALSHFRRVAQIDPFDKAIFLDLAELYYKCKDFAKARNCLRDVDPLQRDRRFRLIQAQICRHSQDYSLAQSILQELIEQGDTDVEVFFTLGELLKDQLHYESAKQAYEVCLELDPAHKSSLEALLLIARTLDEDEEALRISSLLDQLPSKDKGKPDIEEQQLELEDPSTWIKEENDSEVMELRSRLNKDPENLEAHLQLGDLLYKKGYFESAGNQWRLSFTLSNRDPEIAYRLADWCRQKGELDEAQKLFGEIYQNSSECLDAALSRAKILFEMGQVEESRAYLIEVHHQNVNSPLPLVFLCRIARYNQDHSELRELSEKILKLDPDHLAGRENFAIVCLQEGQLEEAIRQFRYVLTNVGHSSPESLYYLGVALKIQKEYTHAHNCFQRVIQDFPRHALAHYQLGVLCKEKGNHLAAEQHLKKAIFLDGEDLLTRQHLATLYYDQEDYEKAIDELFKALEIEAMNFLSLFYLGLSFFELTRYKKAVHYFQEALRTNPKEARVYYHLAQALDEIGDEVKAAAQLRKAIELEEDGSALEIYCTEMLQRIEQRSIS